MWNQTETLLGLKSKITKAVFSVFIFTSLSAEKTNKVDIERIHLSLKAHKIVPDVLTVDTPLPQQHLQVTYGLNVVKYGTELYSLQIEKPPSVYWKAEKNALYSLIAVGPDMPSYAEPDERCWLHWAVGNIPESNVSHGRTITPYGGLNLGYQLGPHRIVFIVYKQPRKKRIKFLESEFNDRMDFFRRGFYNPYVFVERYNLSTPVGVNFFIGLWENEVHQAGTLYFDDNE